MRNFIIFIIIATTLGCNKDEKPQDPLAKLPPETQTGANTFGCVIDGKVVIPRDGTGTTMGGDDGLVFWGDPSGNQQYNELDIHDYKSYRTASILVHIQNLRQIGDGEYIIDQSNGMKSIDGYMHNYIHCRIFSSKTNSYQWYRSYDNSGVLNVTRFDWGNGIISGNFKCRVINSANINDTIEINLGRFDLNGYTLLSTKFP